jgi:hypothetical protein
MQDTVQAIISYVEMIIASYFLVVKLMFGKIAYSNQRFRSLRFVSTTRNTAQTVAKVPKAIVSIVPRDAMQQVSSGTGSGTERHAVLPQLLRTCRCTETENPVYPKMEPLLDTAPM